MAAKETYNWCAREFLSRVARRAMGGEEASRGAARKVKRVAGSSERARAAV